MLVKLILFGLLMLALSSYADAPTIPIHQGCAGMVLGGTCYTIKLPTYLPLRKVA